MLRRVYLAVHAAGVDGATADELETLTRLGGNTVRPRLVELQETGFVVRTDRKRRTRSGRMAYVYVASEPPPAVPVERGGQVVLPLEGTR